MNRATNWDDLRLVLAVARAGSLSGAARALGIAHSTVFRRLGAVEQTMGVRLFERFRDGYAPTPAGERVARVAGGVADEVLSLELRFSGEDLRPSGQVRITTTDTISAIVIRHLPKLRRSHPDIRIDIVISNAVANLTRREADIAVRPTAKPPETLIGRRVADIAHAIYASRAHLSRHRDRELAAHNWIGLDDSLADTVIGGWISANVPDNRVSCRVDALPALRDAASAGLGLALLPCYLGDGALSLGRLTQKTLAEPRSALWLLTHKDLRRTARIRAVMEFLAAALGSERALLEGRQPARALLR